MGAVTEPGRGVHPDVRKEHRNTLVGIAIAALSGVAIIVGVFGVRPRTPSIELARSLVYALPGALLLVWVGLMARIAAWYRRSSQVYYTRSAVPMRMRAFRSRTGALAVQLHRLSDALMREAVIRIQPQAPRWDTTSLEDQVVKVHLDDDPDGPVVVESQRGILWPAPLSRRYNHVEGWLR